MACKVEEAIKELETIVQGRLPADRKKVLGDVLASLVKLKADNNTATKYKEQATITGSNNTRNQESSSEGAPVDKPLFDKIASKLRSLYPEIDLKFTSSGIGSTSSADMLQRTTSTATELVLEGNKRNSSVYAINNKEGTKVGEIVINEVNTLAGFLSESDVSKAATTFTTKEFKNDVVVIDNLEIDSEHRGNYYGVSALNEVLKKYPRGTTIVLDAYPMDDNMSQEELVTYYEALGFEPRMKRDVGVVIMSLDWNKVDILLQQSKGRIKGQADLNAMSILIDERIMTTDTLPHEYAHHYIHWFRDTPLVQEAIKKWGSEEALVQAIGEQVVKQKGEAYGWWKKFSNWLKDIFSNLDKFSKKELVEILTEGFLTSTDIKEATTGYYKNHQSSAVNNLVNNVYKDKGIFTSIQEFIEYSESVFKDSKVDYILTHSTEEPFNGSIETSANAFIEEYADEAADYVNKLLSTNYEASDIFYSPRNRDGELETDFEIKSKIEDELKEHGISVYQSVAGHFANLYSNKTSWVYKEKFSKDRIGSGIGGNYAGTGFYFYGLTGKQFSGYEVVAKLNISNLSEYNDKKWKEKSKDGYIGEIPAIVDKGQVEIVVSEPEQIHIFGSDTDIEMFKKWKLKQENGIILPTEVFKKSVNKKIECKE